jgi:hypothetical protein
MDGEGTKKKAHLKGSPDTRQRGSKLAIALDDNKKDGAVLDHRNGVFDPVW